MPQISVDNRESAIVERARLLYREEYDGQEAPVPEPYMRRAERQLIAEGTIQPKVISVDNLSSQKDT